MTEECPICGLNMQYTKLVNHKKWCPSCKYYISQQPRPSGSYVFGFLLVPVLFSFPILILCSLVSDFPIIVDCLMSYGISLAGLLGIGCLAN